MKNALSMKPDRLSAPGAFRNFRRLARVLACALGLSLAASVLGAEPPASIARNDGLKDIVLTLPPIKMIVKPSKSEIEITLHDRSLLLFAMAPEQFKPYVKELRTLHGENFLLDSPSDHRHHHGLMYGITVNGRNFWEEATDPGIEQVSPVPMRYVARTPEGHPMAVFTQGIFWLADTNRAALDRLERALLREVRTLTLVADEAAGEVALAWHAEFTAGPGTDVVKLTGANYHGLGMRFVRAFDHQAKHLNSENAPYSAEQRGDVIPARWAATEHEIDGQPVTVAIFASPHNAGKSHFFSMLDPFAYLSATQNLDQAPLEYKRNDKFTLDYLVLDYPEHKSREFLEARYQKWLKELAAKAQK